jgi:hypothetical protein
MQERPKEKRRKALRNLQEMAKRKKRMRKKNEDSKVPTMFLISRLMLNLCS